MSNKVEKPSELRGMHVTRVEKLMNTFYKMNPDIIDSWEDLKAMAKLEVSLPTPPSPPQSHPQPEPEIEPEAVAVEEKPAKKK